MVNVSLYSIFRALITSSVFRLIEQNHIVVKPIPFTLRLDYDPINRHEFSIISSVELFWGTKNILCQAIASNITVYQKRLLFKKDNP